MRATKSTNYEVYRVRQPRSPQRGTGSLFDDSMSDHERRTKMITEAVHIGMTQTRESNWVAGNLRLISGGVMFKVGERMSGGNYDIVEGDFVPTTNRSMRVADVLIDFATGIMLVYKSRSTPSSYIAALRFKEWLKLANKQFDTGFETIVNRVPLESDFIAEINAAQVVSQMSFAVHPPNPSDEDDIVQSIAKFSEAHGLSSTSVSIHSEDIDRNLASRIARAATHMGESVSAYIVDKAGNLRTIRTKKKARVISGNPNPTEGSALSLLGEAKAQLRPEDQ